MQGKQGSYRGSASVTVRECESGVSGRERTGDKDLDGIGLGPKGTVSPV